MSMARTPNPVPLPAHADFIAYHAAAAPERVACVEFNGGARLTYREFDRRIAKCAGYLEAMLAPATGKRVAVLARNGIDILTLHFACIRAGAILQPLNWRLSGAELAALVADGGPELFIYQAEFEDAAKQAMGGVRHTVRIAEGDNRLAAAIDAAPAMEARAGDPDSPVTLLYTSGTTGKAKGVIVTNANAWATAVNFALLNEVAPRDVLLCDMPMFHVAGLFGVSRAALLMGGTVLISDRFVPAQALVRMADPALKVTHYFAVPQMAAAMFNDPTYTATMLRKLKALVIGGAPLPIPTIERLLADRVHAIEGYGSSEAGTVFGMPLDLDTIAKKKGSAGVPAIFIQARLVGAGGRDVKAGEVGEIWLKGPSVTPGYWNQPAATAKHFSPDFWFKTGDAARRDEDGFYYIVDRWKDMYISGGENVYPAEVESVLAAHPHIADAAVVGVADAQWGEVGVAFIVARGTLNDATVVDHCRSKLARFKIPKHVRFVEALPRTASGKIRKDELRRAFSKGEN
jgi:fatty-acyl-CoA synthase